MKLKAEMIKEIKTVEDVKIFFNQLLDESLNFHPDEDFANYINIDTRELTYSDDEAELRNKLMDRCFVVCDQHHSDIYELAQELTFKYTGMDEQFPLG